MNQEEAIINDNALLRRARSEVRAKKGSVVIDERYCKGCGFCISACPTGTLLFRDTPSSRWGVEVIIDSPENCIGCRQCEMHCPDFAIFAY